MTVGLEPVDSGGTVAIEACDSFIAAAKRGLYVTNEINSPVSNHYTNIYDKR